MKENPAAAIAHGYRADIDGLRAVAVLLVVLYHFHIGPLNGGFVGVDVFFVISGYLITQIIDADLKSGRFTVVDFYERRTRRIAPALFAMLAATTAVAFAIQFPTEVVDYGRSLVAATLSLGNVYFWATSGYFEAPAALKPLLHTWSLGVEEQFYVVFPLLMLGLYRIGRQVVVPTLLVLALMSLAGAAYVVLGDATSAFYLPHLRAWELLVGALLALGALPPLHRRWQRELAAWAGLGLIAYAGLAYTAATTFPGLSALLPCGGAVLVIAAGRHGHSSAARILSLWPSVRIGQMSYSMYLWHWPLLVFQNSNALIFSGTSPRVTKLGLLALCVLLAWLSWRYVEQPFRAGPRRPTRRRVFQGAMAGAALSIGAGLLAVAMHGLPFRFKPESLQMAGYMNYTATEPNPKKCFLQSRDKPETFDSACLQPVPSKINYLLIGDSHAAHWWAGLAGELDGNVMQATASRCTPTLDQRPGAGRTCSRLMNDVFTQFLPQRKVDKLIVAAYWKQADMPAVQRLMRWTRATQTDTVFFGPMVVYDAALPRLLASAIESEDPASLAAHRLRSAREIDVQMKALAQSEGVQYVSLLDLICPGDSCLTYAAAGVPLQYDYGHLTNEGARVLARQLRERGVFSVTSHASTTAMR